MSGQSNGVVPLAHEALAALAPNYETMRQAIAKVERVDEIKRIADMATAAQAYYRVSCDIENEMGASRIRTRAERRMGELLREMRENGQRVARQTARSSRTAQLDTPTLADLGIPRDRASRAMQLASVPEEEFEDALAEPGVAKPRSILNGRHEKNDVTPSSPVPFEHSLDLCGNVRRFGKALEHNELPPLALWRTHLIPYDIAELRTYLPPVIAYLSAIYREIQHESA